MCLLILLVICLPITSSSYHSLILEFSRRERVNTMILFHCDNSKSVNLFRNINANFRGPVHVFDIAGSRFYVDHRRYMATKHHRLGVVADLRCPKVDALMELSSTYTYFNASFRWIVFASGELQTTLELLRTKNLNVDTRLTLALSTPESNDTEYHLYEIFGTIHRRGGILRTTRVGTWSQTTGASRTCSTNSYQLRRDLGGVQLWSVISVCIGSTRVFLNLFD